MTAAQDSVADLLKYIDASPSPYHAVEETVARLRQLGFTVLREEDAWKAQPGNRFCVTRGGGTLAAFVVGSEPVSSAGFRWIGAHTDSPNLRIKPNPDVVRFGYRQVGVEVYGGVLLSTWMDRDLSLAGRVTVRSGNEVTTHLVNFNRPLLRIPNLAIHLNRTVNTDGLAINSQLHLPPIVGLEGPSDFRSMLAAKIAETAGKSVSSSEVLSWDLCTYDMQPSTRSGYENEFIHAPRLDNLASCHAALSALSRSSTVTPHTRGIVLYDHEECGSRSAQGAASPFLRTIVERVIQSQEASGAEGVARSLARSWFVSLDMAHAVHPNYPDRHEPQHMPVLGRGPVIKVNSNQSYATDAISAAHFERLCIEVGVAPQRFVARTDLGCGSTIGSITAAELGIRAVDAGNPMLSMHSCREMAGSKDVEPMIAVLTAFFNEARGLA